MRRLRQVQQTPEERAVMLARLDGFLGTIKPGQEWPALGCARCGRALDVYYGARSETWRATHGNFGFDLVTMEACRNRGLRWVGPKDRAEFWAGFGDLVPVNGGDPDPETVAPLRGSTNHTNDTNGEEGK